MLKPKAIFNVPKLFKKLYLKRVQGTIKSLTISLKTLQVIVVKMSL